MIERILPPQVAAVESFGDISDAMLFPEESAAVRRAVESRRREFASGRACARAALGLLGQPPAAVPAGLRGAPQWPEGVVGSITHCAGYRAAAVALAGDVLSLGVDAEPDEALPDQGMLEIIALVEERARLAELTAGMPGVAWDRLLFSAKESVYKTWFPLARCWLGFESADVCIDAERGTFSVRLLIPGPLVHGVPLSTLHGRWTAAQGLLVTTIVLLA
jgi:4'-phosphopantetheinyl transferase EntD